MAASSPHPPSKSYIQTETVLTWVICPWLLLLLTSILLNGQEIFENAIVPNATLGEFRYGTYSLRGDRTQSGMDIVAPYGPGDQRSSEYFKAQWEDPKTFLEQVRQLTQPQERKSPGITVAGVLFKSFQDEKFYLAPLVAYQDKSYHSVYIAAWNKDPARASSVRQMLQATENFWLYVRGRTVGTFKVSGLKDLSKDGGPQIAFAGGVHWQSKAVSDIDTILYHAIALSRSIPQPFWAEGSLLSPERASSLNQLLQMTLGRAPVLLSKDLRERNINYTGTQRVVGTAPKNHSVEIMDLDRDGLPEVYTTLHWGGEPCAEVFASVLATWKGSWIVLRRSTYMAECPWFETAGEDNFILAPVDIDGDGTAELMISEGRWESWRRVLYQIRDGKLVKILNIGGYGS